MAYLDTGELPWDMDLFDKTIEVSSLRLTFTRVDRLTNLTCCYLGYRRNVCVGVAFGMPMYIVSQLL